nr:PD-(D/E)XK nuclease family protein [Halarchaeum acidiphilum]
MAVRALHADHRRGAGRLGRPASGARVPRGRGARVLCYGQLEQTINQWRNAEPALFRAAIADGEYLGREWETHAVETADRTYRQRPALADATNAVAGAALRDPDRGGGDAGTYTEMRPVRAATADPSLHVATFAPHESPATDAWYDPPADGLGSGGALAEYLVGALAAGELSLTDGEGAHEPIRVLFRYREHMPAVRDALEARGLSVGVPEPLFDQSLTEVVVALLRWLDDDPTDPERTRASFATGPLDADDDDDGRRRRLRETVAAADWDVAAAAESIPDEAPVSPVLDRLASLATDLRRRRRDSLPDLARALLDVLVPGVDEGATGSSGAATRRPDPLSLVPDSTARRRLAVRDAIVDHLDRLARRTDGARAEALNRLDARIDDESESGFAPVYLPVDEADADVVLDTIHSTKGDQASTVALGDPAHRIRTPALFRDTLVAHGDALALRPPSIDANTRDVAVGGYDSGLFAVSPRDASDAGLRWFSNAARADDPRRYAGPPALAAVPAAKRAEEWRLLYVAMTRARDDLVVPLEATAAETTVTTSWSAAIADALDGISLTSRATHTLALPRPDGTATEVAVSVNDVPGRGPVSPRPDWPSPTSTPTLTRDSPVEDRDAFPLRFVSASALHPLATDRDAHLLDSLLDNQLETEYGRVPPSHPLPFDALAPGDVGRIAHDAIASLIEGGANAAAIRADANGIATDAVTRAIARRRREMDRAVPRAEREAIADYLRDTVLPQVTETDLYELLDDADAVYVEEPLDTVASVADLDIEVGAQADVVLRIGDRWYVHDFKLAFADGTDEADQRSRLQLGVYAWALCRQEKLDPSRVTTALTFLGARADADVTGTVPPGRVPHWLAHLHPDARE